ncbi:MAG: ABC transporter substrate-binding protein [Mycobacteriales bacterium]
MLTRHSAAVALTAAALALTACGGSSTGKSATAPTTSAPAASGDASSPAASASSGGADGFNPTDFSSVLAAAKGQTVNWYMYGGDDKLNGYVNGYVKSELAKVGVTLNQVKITDTVDAVNKVLAEKQAGKTTGGSVDLIWINGENFATLKQADAVYCGYVAAEPSAKYVDLTAQAVANDFGLPVSGCETPWQQATSALVYNSSHLTKADTSSVSALFAWAKAHPGRFTYPAPPDFTGSMVVRSVFYDTAGGPTSLLGPFDASKYAPVADKTWKRLNDLAPSLYRGGKTYPKGEPDVEKLFGSGQIDAFLTYDSSAIGQDVAKGTFPKTTKSAVFDSGNIGNYSYTAIPSNAAHKAAAIVLANLLLSPEAAIVNAGPQGAGFTSADDLSKVTPAQRAKLVAAAASPYQVDAQTLSKHALPELQSTYVTTLEKDWKTHVLEK